jgi:hypothetical protein
MAQICELLNERFGQLGTYRDVAGLFTPFHPNLCKTAAIWPAAMQRNLATQYADPIARGLRVAAYLRFIKNKYMWLIASDCGRLNMLIKRAELGVTASQAAVITILTGERGSIGYDPISRFGFEFPKDHGWHYNIMSETWRFMANVYLDQLQTPITLTLEITRKPLVPKSFWGDTSGASNMVMIFQYLLTVPMLDRTIKNSVEVDGAWQIDSSQTQPFFIGSGDAFQLRSIRTDGTFFPLEVICKDPLTNIKVTLQIFSVQETQEVNVGERKERKFVIAETTAERFYNWNRVDVTSGRVEVGEDVYLVRSGLGWLEHQFGYQPKQSLVHMSVSQRALNNIKGGFSGVQTLLPVLWLILQLDDGTVINTNTVGAKSGRGPFLLKYVEVTDKQNNRVFTRGTIIVKRYVVSPTTGVSYPAEYRLDLPDVYSMYEVAPTRDDQFNSDLIDVEYFQAGCLITGSNTGTCLGYVPYHMRTLEHLRQLDFEDSDTLVQDFTRKHTPTPVIIASLLLYVMPILLFLIILVVTRILLNKQ